MLDLLPVFFAAAAVGGSVASASLGALAKAACIRLFRPKGQRLSVSLLLGTTVAESVIMSVSLFLAFIVVEPYATPQLESKAMFFVAFFLMTTVFHIAFAWLPNLYLLGRMSSPSNSFDNTIADWVWAGLLASMTPCVVVSIALSLGLYYFS